MVIGILFLLVVLFLTMYQVNELGKEVSSLKETVYELADSIQ